MPKLPEIRPHDEYAPEARKKPGRKSRHGGEYLAPLEDNPELVHRLSQTMLPVTTIARILGRSKDYVYEKYSDIIERGREERKQNLAEEMWHKALVEKDTKMMIWLSKQYLNHRDSPPDEQQKMQFNIICRDLPSEISGVATTEASVSHPL